MQYAEDPRFTSFGHHGASVVFGVTGVDDNGFVALLGEGELGREGAALDVAGGVVVVIVQATFADRRGAALEIGAQGLGVGWLPIRGVVGVNTRGPGDEAGVLVGKLLGFASLVERGADADEGSGASVFRSLDYRVAVAGEGRVREVAVAVDEGFHAAAARGYLRSIQRRTGLAI